MYISLVPPGFSGGFSPPKKSHGIHETFAGRWLRSARGPRPAANGSRIMSVAPAWSPGGYGGWVTQMSSLGQSRLNMFLLFF